MKFASFREVGGAVGGPPGPPFFVGSRENPTGFLGHGKCPRHASCPNLRGLVCSGKSGYNHRLVSR